MPESEGVANLVTNDLAIKGLGRREIGTSWYFNCHVTSDNLAEATAVKRGLRRVVSRAAAADRAAAAAGCDVGIIIKVNRARLIVLIPRSRADRTARVIADIGQRIAVPGCHTGAGRAGSVDAAARRSEQRARDARIAAGATGHRISGLIEDALPAPRRRDDVVGRVKSLRVHILPNRPLECDLRAWKDVVLA